MNTSASDSDEWEASTLKEHESFLNGSRRTINIFGGSGGKGGRSILMGGTGGKGEGPKFRMRDVRIQGNVVIHSGRNSGLSPVPDFENFRRIPFGDLIVEENLGVVENLCRHGRNTITLRRVHTAKVFGSTTPFTVAIYEGKDANEEWDTYIDIHSRLRHPNFMQLFGVSTANGLYAAVFHHEYIPFEQALESYTVSPTHVMYFFDFFESQFFKHGSYLLSIAGNLKASLDSSGNRIELSNRQCTPWLHRTGIVCFEIAHSDVWYYDQIITDRAESPAVHQAWSQHSYDTAIQSAEHLLPPQELSKMVLSLDFNAYYQFLVSRSKLPKYRHTTLEHTASVRVSSWVVLDAERIVREVSFLIDPQVSGGSRVNTIFTRDQRGWYCKMLSDFRRNPVDQCIDFHDECLISLCAWSTQKEAWLSQADHVLSQLGLDFGVCSVVTGVNVHARIHPSKPSISEAILFIPPRSAFLTPDGTRLQYPAEQPYWFDTWHQESLSADKAERLGLPVIELSIDFESVYLDKSTLELIRAFHQGKGFDPDSQNIAKHLGHPLYYFGNEGDPPPQPMEFLDFEGFISTERTPAEDFDSDFDSDDSLNTYPKFDEDRDSDEEERILYPRRTV
ncbi:hypothetical protein R3P38DRAFT_3152229 [Favolaschia claudopus]|uniref:Uncharacterized protein n=1 Tax=Favolaschia claudopus TaxID=2862362 RepID=A0AAV9Z272_9AGAR